MSERIVESGEKLPQKPPFKVQRLCRRDNIVYSKKKPDYKTINKALHNKIQTQESGGNSTYRFKTPTTLRRCSSLISISPNAKGSFNSHKVNNDLQSQADKIFHDNHCREDKLIWRVLYTFTRNISRKRKQNMENLQQDIIKSNETTAKLNIQVSLLKSLIKSDEAKREKLKKRLQDEKKLLETTIDDNNRLNLEMNTLTEILERMKENVNYLEIENNNYKNTQIFLKSECLAFEQQLKKERDNNSLLKYENQLQSKKLEKEVEKGTNEKDYLLNEIKQLQNTVAAKSFALAETETNFQNIQRQLQNSVKEIQELNNESNELRKSNKLLQNEILSMKNTMAVLEDNQQQIYKYFNLHIEG